MSSYKVGNLKDFFKNSQKEENSPSGGLNRFGEIYNSWMENPSFAEFDSHNNASYKSVFGKFFKKSKKQRVSQGINIVNSESIKKSKKMKKGKKVSMHGSANSAEELDISQGMEMNELNASCDNSESDAVKPKMSKKRKRNAEQNNSKTNVSDAVDGSVSKKWKKNKFNPNNSNVVNDSSRSSDIDVTLNEGNEMSDQEDSANGTLSGTSASNVSGLSSTLGGSPQKKKRKNKKKKAQQADNTNVSISLNESTNNEDEQNDEVNDVSSEKKKKRRKKKKSQTGAENILNQSNDSVANEQDCANRKRKMGQGNASTETNNFADNESDQIEDLESAEMNPTLDEAPKKKKKKRLNKLQEENDDDNQRELKNSALSKKEAKLLKKKNKKLKGILPGLDSEPQLTKFSVKSEDMDDKDGSSGDDDKGSFPRTPNKKFVPKAESEEKLQRTLFVGNLPTSVDQKILKDLFKGMGKVESVRLRCAVPPKPSMSQKVANIKHEYHKDATSLKGFVVFEEKEDAEKALSLNGTVFNGNHILVDKAFGPKPQNGTPPSANKVQQFDNKDTLFIGNLPYDIDDETLWSTFSGCGTVKGVRVVRDRATGVGKGFAFVEFEDASSIKAALALEGTDMNGRPMRVKRCENKPKNDGPRQFQKQRNGNGGAPQQRRNWNGGAPQQRRNGNDGAPQKRRFGFKRFQRNDAEDSGPRKTFKKMNNKRKFEQEKKKIAAIFKTKKS